jgi:hypothetical protein
MSLHQCQFCLMQYLGRKINPGTPKLIERPSVVFYSLSLFNALSISNTSADRFDRAT